MNYVLWIPIANVSSKDHVLDGFVVPPIKVLYRTWVRHLVACDGLDRSDCAGSLEALGAGFTGYACNGRVPLAPQVVDDLSVLFRRHSGLGALRFPSFW